MPIRKFTGDWVIFGIITRTDMSEGIFSSFFFCGVTMLEIDINDVKAKKYKLFINYALSNCDHFSFVIDKYDQNHNDLLESLKLNCPQDVLSEEFVFVHPETGTNFDSGYMITMKCGEYARSLFIKVNCIADFDGSNLPEDLCLYRNGKIWLKLISHEKLLFVLNENADDVDFLKLNKIHYSYTI